MRQSRDESFLIYSNAKLGQIKAISTDPDKPEEVIPPITDLLRPVAVDYDAKFQYIYYSDALNHRIGRRKVNDTGPGTKDFITEGNAALFNQQNTNYAFYISVLTMLLNCYLTVFLINCYYELVIFVENIIVVNMGVCSR